MYGYSDDAILANILPEDINDYLAQYTLEGKWEKVVTMYEKFPGAHTTLIDESIGTALHVAVEMDEEKVVEALVKEMVKGQREAKNKAMEMENERGDTPLHIAASRGFAKICKCIIGENNERIYLLSFKNNQGETPLFLAAINWRKQAFAYLSHISRNNVNLFDLVRENGDSILHCAIQREYFDLAVIIVHYYDFLSYHTNKEEFTPLKVLATRPSAFSSGSNLTWWMQILYYCIPVEPLEVERAMESMLRKMNRQQADSDKMHYPENYATCYDFFTKLSSVAALLGKDKEKYLIDTESLQNGERSEKYQVGFLPPNYATIQQFVRSAYVHILGLSGVGLKAIRKTKKKHTWSDQLLKALMKRPYEAFTGSGGQPADGVESDDDLLSVYRKWKQGETSRMETPEPLDTSGMAQADSEKGTPHDRNDTKMGTEPGEISRMESPELLDTSWTPQADSKRGTLGRNQTNKETKPENEIDKKETAFLVAAKNGVVEMVTEILSRIPSAIHNTNSKKENVLLVAVTNRQPLVVETLRTKSKPEVWNNLILAVDDEENTILHLAAEALSEDKPWQIPGSAMQMMWDIKWFQYIKSLVPQHFYFRSNKGTGNKKGAKTAGEIFKESHKDLVKDSSDWLKDTSESCSVVAALIAGVSFATASTVPGGTEETGKPTLEGQPAFDAFAIASLVGLCFSVTGLIMFLSILTSRKQAKDFRRDLPLKLLLGLSSLFLSIAAMFVSFCTGHFFVLKDKYKQVLFPIYAATCLPVSFYAVAQFPLYVDLLKAILTKVPQPSDKDDNL